MNVLLTNKGLIYSLPLAAILFVVIASGFYPQIVEAGSTPPVAVGTAETSADHMKLAEYFETQVSEAEERLNRHQQLQEDYQKSMKSFRSLPNGQVSGVSLSIVRHCEILVENARRDVEAYQAIAQQHREMAKAAKK